MKRHRLAVALLPPERLSQQVDGLRRVLGDRRLEDLPSHLTVVPPVNVRADAVPALRRLLREVATRTRTFSLELGPAASFAPVTPTVHLSVGGDLEQLADLRARVKTGPLERRDEWPFVAHVTLRESMPPEGVDAALATLTSSLGAWPVDRLHLLEHAVDAEVDGAEARRRWRVIVEEPFGGPDVVGRGGVELVLRTLGMVEPEVSDLLDRGGAVDGPPGAGVRSGGPDARQLVVVAELPGRPGEPIAAVCGTAGRDGAVLDMLHVDAEHQGMGVARQVVARWCTEAARRGAGMAVAVPEVAGGALVGWGFSAVGTVVVRQLGPARAE